MNPTLMKEIVDGLKAALYGGVAVGGVIGAVLLILWFGMRGVKQAVRVLDSHVNKVHVELTDTENGSFRGVFTRFQSDINGRFDRFESKLGAVVDQNNMLQKQLDEIEERPRRRRSRKKQSRSGFAGTSPELK